MINTKITCPLGSQCEVIKGDTIERCAWYIAVKGENPQTGEQVDDKGCAMSWIPILLIDNSRNQKSTAAAVESLRNTVAGDAFSKEDALDFLQMGIDRAKQVKALPG